ncbi:MAG: right-handed parallel beta-helix repeat-containing protein [Nitrosomonadales bacterium]|nr:right-handed parallel beta-helix repeat-containing protein [Nitrosomonadales bacterium]
MEYRWDFGDPLGSPVSGTAWNTGSNPGASSRNSATGPVAAHVYERPGTYTVTLDVTDGANTVTNSCIRITVQDPDLLFSGANTICVAATQPPPGGWDGCPAGAMQVVQPDFASAVGNRVNPAAGHAKTGKRVLFRRGDTFTASTTAAIIRNGPGIVGAFGTNAQIAADVKPKVQMTANGNILNLSSATTAGISDWRVMDLELDGMSYPTSPKTETRGIAASGGINQVTLLRALIRNTTTGIAFSPAGLDFLNNYTNPDYHGHVMWDQIAVADSSILNTVTAKPPGGVGFGMSARRASVLGSIVDDTTLAGTSFRVFYMNKGVISHNRFSKQHPNKAVIKLHGPSWCHATSPSSGTCNYRTASPTADVAGADGGYSQQIVLSDNKIESGQPWAVTLTPQNIYEDERVRDVVFERNWVAGNNSIAAVGVVVNARDITVRNNIFTNTGSGVRVWRNYIEPPPDNVHIYNNTIYTDAAGEFMGIRIDSDSSANNTIVRNNLFSAPFATSRLAVANAAASTIQGNNLLNNTPSALFASATPSVPADFRLKALPNPARDTGIVVRVWSDFFRTARPQSGVPGIIDVGAVEFP